MLMVIFGAGASYDSFATYPPAPLVEDADRPPLAVQLFNNRHEFAKVIARFPDCRSVINDLRHRDPNESIERVLERLREENTDDVGSREMTAIKYYLQQIVWECEERWQRVHAGATNYANLLRKIRLCNKAPGPACFVTFNYDTMLEKAMHVLDGEIETIHDYINSQRYKIFKIHGSVNWGKLLLVTPFDLDQVAAPDVPFQIIRHAHWIEKSNHITNDYRIMEELSKGKMLIEDGAHQEETEHALFPAITIPVQTKVDFELPPGHLQQLTKLIPQTTKLLIIGWRATDEPFLKLFVAKAKPNLFVHIVCEKKASADEVALQMKKAGVNWRECFTDYQGFTDFVLRGKAEAFLKL